jgi:Zn-finger nucleic acid-binding protein
MKCPVDNETLVMTERSGVEIDYCPKCRGVWLDRGELDKIIEKSASAQPQPQTAPQPPPQNYQPQNYPPQQPQYQGDRYYGDKHYGDKRYYKKRESFLSDLFDF